MPKSAAKKTTKLSDIIGKRLKTFVTRCTKNNTLWGLHSTSGWLILSTTLDDQTEISALPVWSSKEAIHLNNIDTKAYLPTPIVFGEFMKVWTADLANDHLHVGLDWDDKEPHITVNIIDLEREFLKQRKD
ncbi:MAG: DUF2750 domain-containing protein [Flavobacteriales bacterium]|nr:DUF2750 domain-containing protein [Flavobacteriales bacterium]